MNGLVARLTLLRPHRLIRGIVFLACCFLSVGLIGAVHTRTRDVDRTTTVAEADSAVELASYQPTTVHTLLPPAPVARPAAGTELLSDNPPPSAPTTPRADAKSLAALIASPFEKVLAAPAIPAPQSVSPRVILMEVTAYCPCKKCCGPRAQGITASGRPVTYNGGRFVAADKAISFNTKLVIPGYGDGQAVPVLDRGGAIKGNRLDVYYPTHAEALQWGRQWVDVAVVVE